MAFNYVLLNQVELNASAASVTFSNIPQSGYTDLKIVMSARSNRSDTNNDWAQITFNNTTTNYDLTMLYGGGAATYSYTQSSGAIPRYAGEINGDTGTANVFGNLELYVPNYTSSNYKSYSCDAVSENNATAATVSMTAGIWANTSAITSIKLNPYVGTLFLQYSTFSLYGLAAVGTTPAIAPKATGGNLVTTDGTYWYHAFTSSGTFTPMASLSCDYFVVAGGGGGAIAGGGGAGGLRGATSQSLSATGYAVTVGAGGAALSTSYRGNVGSSSSFNNLSTTGGGGGGAAEVASNNDGGTGGSGGGGGTSAIGAGGSATGGSGNSGGYSPVEGYAGGSGVGVDQAMGAGGGGGAGGVGTNGSAVSQSSGTGGAGGVGSSAYSSWGSATGTGQLVSSTYYYAGGGGGGRYKLSSGAGSQGLGGSGGGGNGGGGGTSGSNGTANTGGGGGGRGLDNTGNLQGSSYWSGGSGIVIIRYAV